jgi:F-type H+-transporting ATPase subunit a
MRLPLAAHKDPQEIFNVLLEHLVPHKYSWTPHWAIGGLDLSPTNAVINIWGATILVILIFMTAASKPKIVPKGIQNMIEVAMSFVKEQIVDSVMKPSDAKTWFPFVATIFFFIFMMNAIGLIPYVGYTPTSNVFVTAALAVGVYVLAVFIGVARHGPFKFFSKTLVPDGLPGKGVGKAAVVFFFVIIEIISQIARPFSLAVRLFANELADHVILLIFAGFIFLAGGVLLVAIVPLSVALEVVFTMFALFVAFIQAVIFAFLSTIYINDALHPGH